MTMQMANEGNEAAAKVVRIQIGGEVHYATVETWQASCDELVKRFGGVPKVDVVDAPPQIHGLVAPKILAPIVESLPQAEPANTVEPEPVAPLDVDGGDMDIIGQARSLVDFEAAVAAGFAPQQTVYARGTRVIETGVRNAMRSRRAHDRKPLVTTYCEDFIARIEAEQRTDVDAIGTSVTMDPATGALVLPGGERFMPTRNALSGMASRLGYGGGQYLAKCDKELRAENVNVWRERLIREASEAHEQACAEAREANKPEPAKPEPLDLVLRVRKNPGLEIPEHFGTVTPSYTAFDVDLVAKAISMAVHPEARGTVTYDGNRARFEVMFHSDVRPEHYVAGEFFKAGIMIRTDDTGGGSIWGQSILWQNLCLNLMIIDRNARELFRLKHVGSLDALVTRFKAGFAQAQASLEHFIKVWGYACTENVLERTAAVSEYDVPMKVSEALPGIFNGILERELVPVRARADVAVPKLMQAWAGDESGAKLAHDGLTRASVVNAFTRYAHTEPMVDVWAEDQIQSAASALLWSKGTKSEPAPLPYLPFEPKTTK